MRTSSQHRKSAPATRARSPRKTAVIDQPIPFRPIGADFRAEIRKRLELEDDVEDAKLLDLIEIGSDCRRVGTLNVAERVVLRDARHSGIVGLVVDALASEHPNSPDLLTSFIDTIKSELDVLHAAVVASDDWEAGRASIGNVIGGMQRRCSLVLELQRRVDEAAKGAA